MNASLSPRVRRRHYCAPSVLYELTFCYLSRGEGQERTSLASAGASLWPFPAHLHPPFIWAHRTPRQDLPGGRTSQELPPRRAGTRALGVGCGTRSYADSLHPTLTGTCVCPGPTDREKNHSHTLWRASGQTQAQGCESCPPPLRSYMVSGRWSPLRALLCPERVLGMEQIYFSQVPQAQRKTLIS